MELIKNVNHKLLYIFGAESFIIIRNNLKKENKMSADTTEERNKQNRKTDAVIAGLVAETANINTKNKWYVAIIASFAALVIVAVVKLFL